MCFRESIVGFIFLKGSFSKLASFIKFVELLVEGFEEEIFVLLRRLELRKKGKTPRQGLKKIFMLNPSLRGNCVSWNALLTIILTRLMGEEREKGNWELARVCIKLYILLWNVKGINEGDKHRIIKSLIHSYLADLVCLQEPKVQPMLAHLVRRLGVSRCFEWGVVEARG